jgi:hypothetical protein
MFDTGRIPEEMKQVIVVMIYKKGDARKPENWRTISLLCHVTKLVEMLAKERLETLVSRIPGCIPINQFGFSSGCSIYDAALLSKAVTEASLDAKLAIYKAFLDLRKAYDKVDRVLMWRILRRLGVPEKLLRIIIELHEGFTARVRHNDSWSESFALSVGLKQGSVLSPLLFNIFFGAIVAQVNARFAGISGAGVQIKVHFSATIEGSRSEPKGGEAERLEIYNVLFADDAEIFATTREALQEMLRVFDEVVQYFGQEVSVSKSKILIIGDTRYDYIGTKQKGARKANAAQAGEFVFNIGGEVLEVVNKFKALGMIQSWDGRVDMELKERINKMAYAFHRYRKIAFSNEGVAVAQRLRLYNSLVLSVAAFGCPLWHVQRRQLKKLTHKHTEHMKVILRIREERSSWGDVLKSAERLEVKVEPVVATVYKRFITAAAKFELMDGSLQQKFLRCARETNNSEGAKLERRGRKRTSRASTLKDALAAGGLDVRSWKSIAAAWDSSSEEVFVEEYCRRSEAERANESTSRHAKAEAKRIKGDVDRTQGARLKKNRKRKERRRALEASREKAPDGSGTDVKDRSTVMAAHGDRIGGTEAPVYNIGEPKPSASAEIKLGGGGNESFEGVVVQVEGAQKVTEKRKRRPGAGCKKKHKKNS